MAAVVATMVVGPLVKIVMEKVSSSLLDQYKVMKGLEKQRDTLKRKLLAILDVITDADQAAANCCQAAARRAGVIAWLEAIKKVAYQGNEIFDEFKYEALRRKAKKEGHYKDFGFHVVKLFPTHNRFIFRQRMGKRLRKVVRDIEKLVTEMNNFHFENQQQQPVSYQWRQTDHDLFDPKEIINRSRAEDKKKIVDILVGQGSTADLTVVPIVGMGGLGKTTLAQLVYNYPEIQKCFDMLLWVTVSDSFDVDSLAKRIVDAAPEKKNDDDTKNEAASKKKKTPLDILQNVVSGKRYLLVLDDVWTRDDHKWKQLKARLEHGGMGSVVLTTTRDKVVAEIMGTVKAYNLEALGRQYIHEIIETRAFSRLDEKEERPPVLLDIVGEIVERCAGVPLAAIALGSLLCDKTTEEEWKAVSSRSNICNLESGILPILKLSYNDLPPHMQQCFAFCAMFPKDYEIDVEKLIQLWIAHGFIIEEKQVRLETIGKRIFNELACRSFFQDVKQVEATVNEISNSGACYSRTTCKIHDLMHDVALSVLEKECALATEESEKNESVVTTGEPSQNEWLPSTARHLFLSCQEPVIKLNNSLENSSPTIQTLLCDDRGDRDTDSQLIYPYNIDIDGKLRHPSKYSSLQALQLCCISSFPLKPRHLHHLRYLDLSRSHIKALPEDMSILYSLQTLNLSGCINLCGLPRNMKYMTALRHLYTHGCPNLKNMPRDLGKLTSLQTLTCFVAGGGSNCSNVGELGNLNQCGQLKLKKLENVTEENAKAANLVNKKELRDLSLEWTNVHDSLGEGDGRVLEELKPHDGLHAIRIDSCGATKVPTWMAKLQNIVVIQFFNCNKLQWLFSRDWHTFPNLKELTLYCLDCLERWWDIDNGRMQGEDIMFPRLEKLSISSCEKLTSLPGRSTFPNLQNVLFEGCPKLTTTAKSPKLSVLEVTGHEAELFKWVARHMTSLTNVKLDSFGDRTKSNLAAAENGLREFMDWKKKGNNQDFPLAVLFIRNFKSGVKELCACFVHLQDLSIWRSDALVYWPEKEFQGLVSLRKLLIGDCYNLTGYAQAPAMPSTSSEIRISHAMPSAPSDMHNLTGYAESPAEPSTSSETRQLLPRLECLMISNCDSLVEVFNIPASLRRMCIESCRKLESAFGRKLRQGQSVSSIHQGSCSMPEVSSSSPRAGAEQLEYLKLSCCGLIEVLHLPPSLKELEISNCSELTSLEARSRELPLLQSLELYCCWSLSSLVDGPQAYSSLQQLYIEDCPSLKTLPTNLQQRLGSIHYEHIDAHYYEDKPVTTGQPTLLKPKTWKYAIRRD